jgi:hypothetical protein
VTFDRRYYTEHRMSEMMFDLTPTGDIVYYTASGTAVTIASCFGEASKDLAKLLVESKYLLDAAVGDLTRLEAALSSIRATVSLLERDHAQ